MDHLKHSFGDMRVKDLTQAVSIPIPAVMFGVLVSFMFGWTVGSLMSRKHAASDYGHDEQWKHMKELKKHHHHGDGPPCRCKEEHKKAHKDAEKNES